MLNKQKWSVQQSFLSSLAIFAAVAAVATVAPGCARKRDQKFVQGQGENLAGVAAYDGREFALVTEGPLGSAIQRSKPAGKGGDEVTRAEKGSGPKATKSTSAVGNVTKAERIDIKNGAVEGLNLFDLVQYKTQADLLGSVPLRAKANTKDAYKIRYKLGKSYLTVLKVAARDLIPMQELPYAEDLGGGKLGVPLVGYAVKGYYRVEQVKNGADEDTHQMTEIAEEDPSKATHVRIDFASRKVFDAVKKIDIFPAGLLGDEAAGNNTWFFSETVVGAAEGNETYVGAEINEQYLIKMATKLKFVKTPSSLRAVNINVDERLDSSDVLNLDPVLDIPTQYKDFRAVAKGKETELKEEEHEERPWSERSYMQVDFEKATKRDSNENESKSGSGAKRLVDLEIDQDYLAYTLEDVKSGVRVKYSFLRANDRNYTPRRAFPSDMKKFGFFTSIKNFIANYEVYSKDDYDKHILLQRFNPKKDIVFHFTATSPRSEAIREVGRKAVAEWNKAFEQAGTGMKVLLDETFDVQLGDLRYNKLNLIETVGTGGLLGYGPSVADPMTGENISSTTNIYINPMRSEIVGFIRQRIMADSGEFAGKEITSIPGAMFRGAGMNLPATIPQELVKKGDLNPLVEHFEKTINGRRAGQLPEIQKLKNQHLVCDQSISTFGMDEEIKRYCPEVSEFAARVKNGRESGDLSLVKALEDETLPVLKNCAERILPERLLPVVLHEMGHNLGLRHNFRGSTDKVNYTGGINSSSVMEYSSIEDDRLSVAGKYDIEAIRFGYSEKVKLDDERIVPIDVSKSLSEQLAESGSKLKPFAFCTDEDVARGADPMCLRFDAGSTPTEIVAHMIREFKNSYRNKNFRFNRWRMTDEGDLASLRVENYYFPIKRIYDEWRFHLARFLHKENNPYLQGMDSETFQGKLEQMKSDPQYGPIYAEYRPAAELAFNFFKSLVSLPNEYCILASSADPSKLDAVEFEVARNELYRQKGISVKSCFDPQVVAYFASEKKASVVSQQGFALNSYRFDREIQDMSEPYDVTGSFSDRMVGMQMFSLRVPLSLKHYENEMFPNFLDEPMFRAEVINTMMSRVLLGASILDLWAGDPNAKAIQKAFSRRLPRWQIERNLIETQFRLLTNGLGVPGEGVDSRSEMFAAIKRVNKKDIPEEVASLAFPLNGYYVAPLSPDSTAVIELMQGLAKTAGQGVPFSQKARKQATDALAFLVSEAKDPGVTVDRWLKAFQKLRIALNDPASFDLLASADDRIGMLFDVAEQLNMLLVQNKSEELKQKKVNDLSQQGQLTLAADASFDLNALLAPVFAQKDEDYRVLTENQEEFRSKLNMLVNIIFGLAKN